MRITNTSNSLATMPILFNSNKGIMAKSNEALVTEVSIDNEVTAKIATNATKEEKLAFIANFTAKHSDCWLADFPAASLESMDNDKINSLLESLNLLTTADLDKVVVRNISSKEAKRDYTKVLVGYNVESAIQVDLSIYAPAGWTEQDVINRLTA